MMNKNTKIQLSKLSLACTLGLISMASTAATTDIENVGALEFKADAVIKGYSINNGDGNFDTGDDITGALTQARLEFNITNQDGWALKTRMLAYYDWAGDRRHSGASGSSYTSDKNVDSFSLDLAFLEYKRPDGWLFRVGRQEANWGYGFNISDDRRDRVLAMKTIMTDGGYAAILGLYDLRFSEEYSESGLASSSTSNLNMYALGAMGNQAGLDWGLVWSYFDGESVSEFPTEVPNPYFIDYFHNISPYLGKTFGNFSIKGAANINLSDANKDEQIYFWGNNSWAAFVETGYQFTPEFQLQIQLAGIGDGGQVGRGWDSYSMLINSSPRNEINPTRTEFFGGFGNFNGNAGESGTILGMRANWKASDDLTVTVAAGRMELDLYNANLSTAMPDSFRDNTYSTFFDVKALYQFGPSSSIELRAGHADGDIEDTAVMTTLRADFG